MATETSTTTETPAPTTADFLAGAEGVTVEGFTPETLQETTDALSKAAVAAAKKLGTAVLAVRVFCYLLLEARSHFIVTRADGSTGPDWEASSQLARDYSSHAVTSKLIAQKLTTEQITTFQSTVSVNMGRKDPASGSDLPLREAFILDWVKANNPEATPEQHAAMRDAEFAAIDKPTAAQGKKAKSKSTGGPGTTKAVAPAVELATATDHVVTGEVTTAGVEIVTQATRLLRYLAAQWVLTGEVSGRPEILAAWPELTTGIAAMSDLLAGVQTDGSALRTFAQTPEASTEATTA